MKITLEKFNNLVKAVVVKYILAGLTLCKQNLDRIV
jgi:hypothetical protein